MSSAASNVDDRDDAWLARTAARALERNADGRVRVEGLARLDGGSDRNVVARAVARFDGGSTEPIVVKAVRGTAHDARSASVLRDSGLAREHVALTVLDARSATAGAPPRLLAGDADAGLIVLRDFGVAAGTLAGPLLDGDAEAGEGAVLGLADALGGLHAATGGCEAEHDAAVAALYPASDGAPPSSLAGLRWAARTMVDALGGEVDEGTLETLAARLVAPGPWTVLMHGDPCPDNALRMSDGRAALLDFEFARPGHALFDATWWHMGFPSCWCAGALPASLVTRADERYRAALVDAIPEVEDDGLYARELAHLCAVQLLWSAPRVLDDALGENGTWGTARYRDRLVHWLSTVDAMLARTGALPGLAPAVSGWPDAVRSRGDGTRSLAAYPALRAGGGASR